MIRNSCSSAQKSANRSRLITGNAVDSGGLQLHEAAERRLHARRGFVVIALSCAPNSPPLIYPGTFFWCAPRCGRVLWKSKSGSTNSWWRVQHDGFWQPSAWLLRDRKFNMVVFKPISTAQAASAARSPPRRRPTQSYPGITKSYPGISQQPPPPPPTERTGHFCACPSVIARCRMCVCDFSWTAGACGRRVTAVLVVGDAWFV